MQQPLSNVYSTVAPWPGQDDGATGRQMRGMAIAARVKITQNRIGYKVPSQSGNGSYVVNVDGDPVCTCPDYEMRLQDCKHIFAVQLLIEREENRECAKSEPAAPDAPLTFDHSWAAYNAAQANEREHFNRLLHELCGTIIQPPQAEGRPRLLLSDVVFSAGVKVYSTMPGRRAMTDLKDAWAKGQLQKVPSFSSLFRYLEDPALTPILKHLIEQSALPLKAVETDFAVDSSGFSTSTFNRWFDHKWGKEIKKLSQNWRGLKERRGLRFG